MSTLSNSSLTRLADLYRRSGPLLAPPRVLARGSRRVVERLNQPLWRLVLSRMGEGSVVQLGVTIERPAQVKMGRSCLLRTGVRILSESASGVLVLEDEVQVDR